MSRRFAPLGARRIAHALTAGALAVTILAPVGVAPAAPESLATKSLAPAATQSQVVVTPLVEKTGDQNQPAVYDDVVVWSDNVSSTGTSYDIYMEDMSAGVRTAITTETGFQLSPEIHGDKVVYRGDQLGDYDIYGYDIGTGLTSQVCTASDRQTRPQVSATRFVWEDWRNADYDIYQREFNEATASAVATAAGSQTEPDTYGDVIVWSDQGVAVEGIDTATDTRFSLGGSSQLRYLPRIDGDRVTYTLDYGPADEGDILLASVSSLTTETVAADAGVQTFSDVYGDFVVWEDRSGTDYDVYMRDMGTGAVHEIDASGGDQSQPAIHRNKIAYTNDMNGNDDIYIAEFDFWAPATKDDVRASYQNKAVVTLTADDDEPGYGGFGVDKTYYRLDGGAQKVYSGPIEVAEAGDHTLQFWSVDEAGNAESKRTEAFEVVRQIADQYTPVSIAGATRYETAIEASRMAFPNGTETVVITTGENWPDALGGSALAGAFGGPILLTPSAVLPDVVMTEIARLAATDAIILGGPGAVSPAVETALAQRLGATKVRRIGGATRYETAELIARAVESKLGAAYNGTALIATGANFPDALGGSPLAAAGPWPILLATPAGLTPSTAATMDDIGVERVLILGGEGVVPAATETGLAGALGAGNVTRLAGADRYATAVDIACWAVTDEGMFFCEGTGFATGENFPDALAGGVVQGQMDAPLLLTRSASLPPVVADALTAQADHMNTVFYYGGPGAIAQSVRDEVGGIID